MYEAALYGAKVRIDEIRALLLRAACSDPADSRMQPVVIGLLDAYVAALDIATQDGAYTPPRNDPACATFAEAADVFRRQFIRDYGRDVEEPFPASVPIRDGLPRFLVLAVARVAAKRREARRALGRRDVG